MIIQKGEWNISSSSTFSQSITFSAVRGAALAGLEQVGGSLLLAEKGLGGPSLEGTGAVLGTRDGASAARPAGGGAHGPGN